MIASRLSLLSVLLFCSIAAASVRADEPLPDGLYAEISTPRGVISAELFCETAPWAVTTFLGLAEGPLCPDPHRPSYNVLPFHRVVPGFIFQERAHLGTGEREHG